MKMNFKYLTMFAAAAAIGFSSCSSDDENVNGGGKTKATVSIGISVPETYATGAPAADAVTNYTAFIIDGGSVVGRYSSTASAIEGIEVSTQASKVYVIANAGNMVSSLTSESAIKGYLADLNGTGIQTAARWATGEANLTFTQSGDDEWEANPSVALQFIAARITVTIDNQMAGYDASATDGSLVLKTVAILNARGESKLFGSSLVPAAYTSGKEFYQGYANASFNNSPIVGTLATSLLSDVVSGNSYHYYVFENAATTAATFPTIVTIVGTYDGKDVFFPVHLAPYEAWTIGSTTFPITRGNSYDITIKLTGDAKISTGGEYPGDTGGGEDPTTPVVSANVTVSISLTPWNPIALTKQFD